MQKSKPTTTKAKTRSSPDNLTKAGKKGSIALSEEELARASGGANHKDE
jgi:hypothetical protein